MRHGRTRPPLSPTNGTQQTPQSSLVGPPQSPQRSRTLLRRGIPPNAPQPSSHMQTLIECLGHSLPGVAHMPGALASWRGTHAWGIRFLAWNTCLEHSLPGVETCLGHALPRVEHMPGAFASWRGTHAWGIRFLAWNACLGPSLPGVEHMPGALASWRGTRAWDIRLLAWNTCLGHSLPGAHAWGIRFLAWNTCLGHSLPGVAHMRYSLPGVEHMPEAFASWRGTYICHAWGVRCLARDREKSHELFLLHKSARTAFHEQVDENLDLCFERFGKSPWPWRAFLSEHALNLPHQYAHGRTRTTSQPSSQANSKYHLIVSFFVSKGSAPARLQPLQTPYGRTRAHALGMRAHMPSYAATANMKHAQHVQTISSRWCKSVMQKHALGMIPFIGPKSGRASAGRPGDIHCECLGPVPRSCVQKLGLRSGPRCRLCFGVADANVKYMPWCQNASEKTACRRQLVLRSNTSHSLPKGRFAIL